MISQFKHRIVLVLILVAILTYAFFSEKILNKDGLGYDGAFYGNFTLHFKEYIRDHAISKYHFQRILIPFIIHYLFLGLDIGLSVPNVILAYSITNIIFIIAGVCFFFRISNVIKLAKSVEIIGFAALFFCFPVLKLCLYYPVLMDIPAFVMAIIAMYFYVKRNVYLFFLVILISSFIYPTFILLSVLYFFNFKQSNEVAGMNQTGLVSFLNNINLLEIVVCYALPVVFIYDYITLYWLSSFEYMADELRTNPAGALTIWLGFLLALLYVVALNYFPRKSMMLQSFFRSINYRGLVLATVVFIVAKLLLNYFTSNAPVGLTAKQYLYSVTHQAVERPMNFIVSHVFYFGLAPLLSLFIIKDIKRGIVNFGFGMILFFNMVVFFSVGSESRQLINYYPFLVLLLICALNTYWEVSIKFASIFVLICLALSHFWYTINKGIIAGALTDDYSCQQFPLQRYFMFHGPWIGDVMYKVHLAVFAFLAVLFWFLMKRTGLINRKTEITTDASLEGNNISFGTKIYIKSLDGPFENFFSSIQCGCRAWHWTASVPACFYRHREG